MSYSWDKGLNFNDGIIHIKCTFQVLEEFPDSGTESDDESATEDEEEVAKETKAGELHVINTKACKQ